MGESQFKEGANAATPIVLGYLSLDLPFGVLIFYVFPEFVANFRFQVLTVLNSPLFPEFVDKASGIFKSHQARLNHLKLFQISYYLKKPI